MIIKELKNISLIWKHSAEFQTLVDSGYQQLQKTMDVSQNIKKASPFCTELLSLFYLFIYLFMHLEFIITCFGF